MAKEATTEDLTSCLDHAWNWFALHAGQRMQMFNYWLLAMAFITTAYVTALGDGAEGLGVFVALAGAFVSVTFQRLERRTRQLVRIAEAALGELQSELAGRTGFSSLGLVREAQLRRGRFASYGLMISVVQLSVCAGFLLAATRAAIAL